MALLPVPRYMNYEDMDRRIGRTIIKYKGKHVYAASVQDASMMKVCLHDIFTKAQYENIDASDEDIDVRAFPIGYINKEDGKALFLARMPIRINKQGLCNENCVYIYRQGPINNIHRSELTSMALFKMLNDDYPSIEFSVKKLLNSKGEDIRSLAISKKLALERSEVGLVNLIYINNPIAVFDPRSESFKITERYAHYIPILAGHGIDAEVI